MSNACQIHTIVTETGAIIIIVLKNIKHKINLQLETSQAGTAYL